MSKSIRMDLLTIAEQEKAEESDRLKSAFLANMSHEIRIDLSYMTLNLRFINLKDKN